MTELKTVKDLTNNREIPIFPSTLKAEAIKWVKKDREDFGLTFQGQFWQERFNITEEDLKEAQD